ncbi:MAG TPA: MscL family protein [Candidatus Paceibacterota bacterium]
MVDIHMEGGEKSERSILAVPRSPFAGFVEFLRERGVAGFAIGFIFGGAAQTFVKALMDDIINPFVGLFLGPVGRLSDYTVGVFGIGSFFSALLNFLILCFVMYFIFKVLHLEKLDKPKE